MPLSDHEQRLLEQMERALSEEDPKFASTLRGSAARTTSGRWLILGALGFVAGLALLFGGVAYSLWIVGVLGFMMMLGGAFVVVSAFRPRRTTPPQSVSGVTASSKSSSKSASKLGRRDKAVKKNRGFMARIEERWRRRRDQSGF